MFVFIIIVIFLFFLDLIFNKLVWVLIIKGFIIVFFDNFNFCVILLFSFFIVLLILIIGVDILFWIIFDNLGFILLNKL